MLEWWGVAERDTLTVAEDASGQWPLDCEMDVSLAARLLRTPLWGVDEVIGAGRARGNKSRPVSTG
jgi:hypothetical protein